MRTEDYLYIAKQLTRDQPEIFRALRADLIEAPARQISRGKGPKIRRGPDGVMLR
jgi:hypothetical protein